MKVGLIIYGSPDTVSGGYLYDRMLVAKLREHGDTVRIIPQRRRSYAANLLDGLTYQNPVGLDILLQDELNHPSLALPNRRPRRAPVISIVHHLRSSERRPTWERSVARAIELQYLNSVDGFIYNSETTADSVQALLARQKPGVIATPGGDRLGRIEEGEVRRRVREPGPLRLVYVGSVTPAKGTATLIEAMSRLTGSEATLDIIGPLDVDADFANRLRRNAAALPGIIQFSGELSDQELTLRLRSSHVLVLPSYYEGFGIVILEGMAHGLPALATSVGAVPGIVTDAKNGLLVEPGDAVTLAERIRMLAADRQQLERLSLSALTEFRMHPTWDQSTDRIRDFLLTQVRAQAS